MTSPRTHIGGGVVGLDLSLTGTGIADTAGLTRVLKTSGLEGMGRIEYIRRAVLDILTPSVDAVFIEGYSFGSQWNLAQLGELGGVVKLTIWTLGITYYTIAPNTLKKFAAGNGRASKEEVVANARERLGYQGFDNNAADALWLWTLGNAYLGNATVKLPQTHTDALKGVSESAQHGGRSGNVITVTDPEGRI
jgi:Holliday junction resolvasome RuvABC endonuclease subunit